MLKSEILRTIGPTKLIYYMKSRGWVKIKDNHRGSASIWMHKDTKGEDYEALMPHEQNFEDYALRVGDLILTISQFENRPPEAIIAELSTFQNFS